MAQQPNVELEPADLPRAIPKPSPPRKWESGRPGLILSPDETVWGGYNGTPGPDTGWGLRLLAKADLPERGPLVEAVLLALIAARASLYGRAPIPEDLEAALVLTGYTSGLNEESQEVLEERRRRWIEAAAHEKPAGRTAVAEVDADLLREKPDRIRYALAHHQ